MDALMCMISTYIYMETYDTNIYIVCVLHVHMCVYIYICVYITYIYT